MTDSRPALLRFDGSEDACRAIGDAGGLLAPRPAVVLTVWETARRLTALDPMGDAVGRESGIYADSTRPGCRRRATWCSAGAARTGGRLPAAHAGGMRLGVADDRRDRR
jgi:hypothetical protein